MAETRIELNTGFGTSQAGISHNSKLVLNSSTPEALVNDSGVLKRAVIEPDNFPKVGLDKTNPPNTHASMDSKNWDRAKTVNGKR